MSDRELLELAAKAAGHDVVFIHDDKIPMRRNIQNHKGMKIWNPLADDGDALRLAIALPTINLSEIIMAAWQAHDDDAARRAYVRREVTKAAADIWRRMK